MTSEGRQEEWRERDIPSQSVPGKELVKCLVCSGNSKQTSVPGNMRKMGKYGIGGHILKLCCLANGCEGFTFTLNDMRS